MRTRKLPPPTQFTVRDKYRLLLAALSVALGAVILARTLLVAVSPPAIAAGLAFVGFGLYRLWLGHTRLKQLNREGR